MFATMLAYELGHIHHPYGVPVVVKPINYLAVAEEFPLYSVN